MIIGKQRKSHAITEYGDFQTPAGLARSCIDLLVELDVKPRSILEPTCGRGSFIAAAAQAFPDASLILGVDINAEYIEAARGFVLASLDASTAFGLRDSSRLRSTNPPSGLLKTVDSHIRLVQGDFFTFDWNGIVNNGESPWLIFGNPPWVTSATLGAIDSANLPLKSNFYGLSGIDAITGKSNFDISEWMLLRYLDWLRGKLGTIAVLCKTAVARKFLLHAWKIKAPLATASIYKIDALTHFGAAVDACFFIVELRPGAESAHCDIFDTLTSVVASNRVGYVDGHLIADVLSFNRHHRLLGRDAYYTWRSGIKHDCSKVMELASVGKGYQNGLGEQPKLEDALLYPLLKSSDIGNGRIQCRNVMFVPQQYVGEDTNRLQLEAPNAWNYLVRHAELLNRRGSSIYKNKPAFSIFGVGPYTFAPWKVAISAFYKALTFVKVGPVDGKPVVFDDTLYFLPCWSAVEANFVESLLNSGIARQFLESMIHWDAKRPITVDILKRLSLGKLSAVLGRETEYQAFITVAQRERHRMDNLFANPGTLTKRPINPARP